MFFQTQELWKMTQHPFSLQSTIYIWQEINWVLGFNNPQNDNNLIPLSTRWLIQSIHIQHFLILGLDKLLWKFKKLKKWLSLKVRILSFLYYNNNNLLSIFHIWFVKNIFDLSILELHGPSTEDLHNGNLSNILSLRNFSKIKLCITILIQLIFLMRILTSYKY